MKFIITVDTEADNQWGREEEIRLKNIALLPRFQHLCERYNFKPTYLVAYEVANDERSVKILRKFLTSGKAEIGAHFHPWTTPPYQKDIIWERKTHRFPHELDDDELSEKLGALTRLIKENFRVSPKSFRAGRWGLDGRVVKEIERLGYIVDCSVTPKISWAATKGDPQKSGGPDYRFASVAPYFLSTQNVCEKGNSQVLEVPMTIIFTAPWVWTKENSLFSRLFLRTPDCFVKKLINGLFFQQKWLRVFSNSTVQDFKKIYRIAARNDLPVLEFMIHSSELLPGGSPYAKNKNEVEFIYKRLGDMFAYFSKMGVMGLTLSEFAQDFSK